MTTRRLGRITALASAGLLVAALAGCSGSTASTGQGAVATASAAATAATGTPSAAGVDTARSSTVLDVWDSSVVHEISVEVDESDLEGLLSTFAESGEKEWISATVTIDGTTITNVGLKLKGNSSLRSVGVDSDPATLPWIIELDKYVDGQSYGGETELVVRGNSSESALNEAVALELLGLSGLATQEASSARFSVNGGSQQLRLVIENPNEGWADEQLGSDGMLYKAESGGSYDYRGDDPDAYDEIFDQEAGEDDLTPLIDFLQFVNEADDATFAAELADHLDVEAFATYLAFQDLVDNFDDISGPGNNSYLWYDTATGKMTVVSWDLNLAFGLSPGGAGQGVGAGPGDGAGGGQRPGGADGAQAGPASSSNVLAERFLADADFAALYDAAVAELQQDLYDSGAAQEVLDTWVATLSDQASDLVSEQTLQEDAESIAAHFQA